MRTDPGSGPGDERRSSLTSVPSRDHCVAGRAAQLQYARLAVAGGVDAVGEQGPGQAAGEIHPEAGAGEAGMADRLVRAGVAAVPAFEPALPAAGAVVVDRRADRLKREGR